MVFSLWGDLDTASETSEAAALPQNVDLAPLAGEIESARGRATRDTGGIQAGRANADFWQGSRQNLPGVMSQTNRANLGAQLGTAHSVMDDAPRAAGRGQVVSNLGGLSERFVQASGAHAGALRDDASSAEEVERVQTQISLEDNASKWNTALGMLSSGIQGYSLGSAALDANPAWKSKLEGWKSGLGSRNTVSSSVPTPAQQPLAQFDWSMIRS